MLNQIWGNLRSGRHKKALCRIPPAVPGQFLWCGSTSCPTGGTNVIVVPWFYGGMCLVCKGMCSGSHRHGGCQGFSAEQSTVARRSMLFIFIFTGHSDSVLQALADRMGFKKWVLVWWTQMECVIRNICMKLLDAWNPYVTELKMHLITVILISKLCLWIISHGVIFIDRYFIFSCGNYFAHIASSVTPETL